MKGVWIVAGIVLFVVLLLGAWLFIFQFGGFAFFLGDEAKEIVENENSVEDRFIGTWKDADTPPMSIVFYEDMTCKYSGVNANWKLTNNNLVIYTDENTLLFDYDFDKNNEKLYLTNIKGYQMVFTKS